MWGRGTWVFGARGLSLPARWGGCPCPEGTGGWGLWLLDDLDAHAVTVELPGRVEAVVRHESPREAAQVGALSPDGSRADGDQVVAVRHLFRDQAVHLLMLEEEDRVRVADG